MTIDQVSAGFAKVEPKPGDEFFATMRDDWTTGETGLRAEPDE